MSEQNVQVVEAVLAIAEEARNGDHRRLDDLTGRLADLVAPDAQIDMSRRVFNPDVYRGDAGLRRLLGEIREVWAEFHIAPERIVDAGDRVVVIEAIRGRGRTSGVEIDSRSASIWTLRGERVAHIQMGYQPREALELVEQ